MKHNASIQTRIAKLFSRLTSEERNAAIIVTALLALGLIVKIWHRCSI